MSLANKYRPQNFDTIAAQDHITDILKAQMKNDQKINHNYLFFGPRGTGKTTAARILAKALNCLDLQNGNPCNQCDNCKTISEGKTLDYVEIDAASHTGVDNIREEILDKVPYPPTQLKKKIYVIDEVHMLSKGAFNALLKTIEEPKENVCFILATTEIHKVPDTIISRCQVFNFKKILGKKMIDRLEEICKLEGLSYDPKALELIAKISEGGMRDAVKYIDQVSVFGDVNEENVTKFLGVASEAMIKQFLDLIKVGDRNEIFEKVDEISDQGVDLVQFAKQNIMYIDQHLMEDTDFLLKISEAFSEIIGTVKYYPYPTMVYKVAINKQLGTQNNEHNNKKENSNSKGVEEKSKTKNLESSSNEKESTNEKNDIVVEEEKSNQESTKKTNIGNYDEIMKKLVDLVESNTLKDNLKNHTIVKNIGDGKAQFIVINKMAEVLLGKEDTKKMLENFLEEITGENLIPEFEFQSKEDYFANQL
ncbi:MAG TPA: DNA polymerase III subunit gamma/tau [Candidatus Absconditabacterales bacterium]|nr:DNA polymerase III subunit gamma/tau [Candidatus Absconditabacterales bacterium]